MAIRRGKHAFYDIKYHFVWIPKYRKHILTKGLKKRVEELFQEIARQYDFEIDAMGVEVDHVHIFLSAPPKYSPAKIVVIFDARRFPETLMPDYFPLSASLFLHQ